MFHDRVDAGRALAAQLQDLALDGEPVVLGLPRGGIPVALEVARALHAPLAAFVVRKVGVPGHEELAMGSIATGGALILDNRLIGDLRIGQEQLERAVSAELRELHRREEAYDGSRAAPDLEGRTVILVDDGLATGLTMRAAVEAVRTQHPRQVIVAVPVAPSATCAALREVADQVVCTLTPRTFVAVGQWYEDFSPTTDDEVRAALDQASEVVPEVRRQQVAITAGEARLEGDLTIPAGARGVVVFAHGSGSSRFSPRNRQVAAALNRAGLGTLLLDLLTPEEGRVDSRSAQHRFDIGLLSERLVAAVDWLGRDGSLPAAVGLFGASTGAAAALVCAAERPERVGAVVSRGGRPDLAGARLADVRCPTLLVVGGADDVVLDLNRQALAALRCTKRLVVIPGATHLFEEPGALEQVAALAAQWFSTTLAGDAAS